MMYMQVTVNVDFQILNFILYLPVNYILSDATI